MEERNPLLSIDAQMFALAAAAIASIIGVMTLQGIKEQQSGMYPGRDYGFIEGFPKISTAILLAVSIYFAYFANENHKSSPDNPRLTWLLVASVAALLAAVIRFDITYLPTTPTTARIEEEVQ